jgi:hypothetical protein
MREAARIHHPEVAQRKVVADGIDRIQRAQPLRDLRRHLPARARARREAQAAAEANDMRVERDDELSGADAGPAAGIDFVAADHPAQEQIQPLAAAAA